ncbi:MAG: hypothetical protein QNJ15_03185 [Erythrobacter sp.]|nr:hypothetical protein [Erythrobacter sp.]
MQKRIPALFGAFLAMGLAGPAQAQDEAPTLLSFESYQVRPIGPTDGVEVNQREGREELVVSRSAVLLEGVEFSEGVIEFDVAFENKRGFGGLMWHASDQGDAEYFYFRQHKSGLPDAGQYTPMRSGLTSWQIFSDRNGMGPFAYTYDGWNRIKFIIAGDKADIYLNGSVEPILHVPDLATDRGNGGIGFRTSGPNGRIRIADLTIRSLQPGEGIVGTPKPTEAPPSGVIGSWSVSRAFAEADIEDRLTLPEEIAQLETAATIQAEPSGIADLGRIGRPQDEADTVMVSSRILADRSRSVRLRFGYSDRVKLFLNDDLVFDGDAGFRSRDFFSLGTVGFKDSVVLNLAEGENVLAAAVSETFGGWAFAGAIENGDGLTIRP